MVCHILVWIIVSVNNWVHTSSSSAQKWGLSWNMRHLGPLNPCSGKYCVACSLIFFKCSFSCQNVALLKNLPKGHSEYWYSFFFLSSAMSQPLDANGYHEPGDTHKTGIQISWLYFPFYGPIVDTTIMNSYIPLEFANALKKLSSILKDKRG